MKHEFEKMSKHAHRSIEYFISADPINTAIYFGDNKEMPIQFEMIRFGYEFGSNEIFIKYPTDQFFTEVIGGINNSRGSMGSGNVKNPWAPSYRSEIELHIHDTNAFISFHKGSFNFLKLEARRQSEKKGYEFRESPFPLNFGSDHIRKILDMKYLKLPMDVRTIAYAYKVVTENVYIIVDNPTYGFSYEAHDFYVIDNGKIEKMIVKNFTRYKDGGTTHIKVEDSTGNEHLLFSPTKFGGDKKIHLWDNKPIEEIPENELEVLIKILGLEVETKKK